MGWGPAASRPYTSFVSFTLIIGRWELRQGQDNGASRLTIRNLLTHNTQHHIEFTKKFFHL